MRSPKTTRLAALARIIAMAASIATPGLATGASLQRVSTAPDAKPLSARDAGARYGEAAGAALVCSGLAITSRVAELRARYQGADLDEFDAQAGKILQAWRDTLSCKHAEGPSDCLVSQQWSCRQALQEIGPAGSVLRGLVEPKP